MDQVPTGFASIESILFSSMPRSSASFLGLSSFLKFGMLTVLVISLMWGSASPAMQAVDLVLVVLIVGASFPLTWALNRAMRNEQMQLIAAEEAVQLHRWSTAAGILQQLLSRPMRSHHSRLQALIYYGSVMMRYRRFDDVIALQEHLLSTLPLDDGASHALKLSRAMAILRQERLVDADRAISELRRSPVAQNSAGLALLEIYRDVKTGHATEAIDLFAKKKDLISKQLGHRQADAYALVARGWDMLSKVDQAREAFSAATLLAPIDELQWRYPEIESMVGRYWPTPAPAEIRKATTLFDLSKTPVVA